jgi:uncharacterized protein (UPF0332 family)
VTPEQYTLLVWAREDLESARLLAAGGYSRGATSRAYYAMFSTARALLLSRGLDVSSHAAVIATFGKEFAKSGLVPREAHRRLLDAQDARLSADYATDSTIAAEQVQVLLTHAEEFLALAERMLGPIPPADEETR